MMVSGEGIWSRYMVTVYGDSVSDCESFTGTVSALKMSGQSV